MGIAIAKEFYNRGAEVTLITGPTQIDIPVFLKVIKIKSAEQLYKKCDELFEVMDITVMAAAVADYTPSTVSKEKIKKHEEFLSIDLIKTKDILAHLGKVKKANQFLVGFALETSNEKEYALKKLQVKNLDMIVLNSLNDEGAGFGYDTNKITILIRIQMNTSLILN